MVLARNKKHSDQTLLHAFGHAINPREFWTSNRLLMKTGALMFGLSFIGGGVVVSAAALQGNTASPQHNVSIKTSSSSQPASSDNQPKTDTEQQDDQAPATNSVNTNLQQNGSHVSGSVTVNGVTTPLPENGTVQKTVAGNNNNTHVNISVNNDGTSSNTTTSTTQLNLYSSSSSNNFNYQNNQSTNNP